MRESIPKGDLDRARQIIAEFCKANEVAQSVICSSGFIDPEIAALRGECAMQVQDGAGANGLMMARLFNRRPPGIRKAIAAARQRKIAAMVAKGYPKHVAEQQAGAMG